MSLNDQQKWSSDVKFDFAHGNLRLLPAAALSSLSPGEHVAVQQVTATLLDTLEYWSP